MFPPLQKSVPVSRSVVALFAAAAVIAGCTDANPFGPQGDESAQSTATTLNNSPNTPGMATATEDVVGQGMAGPVVAEDAATLRRTPNGISVKVSMPTPEPGSYDYPEGADRGHPEAFTLWVFVFNDPEAADPDGAFWGAGHVFGGPHLELSGHVSLQTEPFVGGPLTNPAGAKVRLAVAPHGALDPDALPAQIQTPSGTPDHWWFAEFD